MSEIEEIRKRHREVDEDIDHFRAAPARGLGFGMKPDMRGVMAHDDRAALLAALDGEWQSERPEDGDWWLSVRPEVRAAACLGDVMPAMVRGSHVMPDRCGWYRLDSDIFTGALWQRRTVPGDPFKGGGR